MKYPKLRELKEAIRSLISRPYTSRFPFEPHKPFERFRGRPYFFADDCTGCTACVQVCPSGALEFSDVVSDGKAKRILTLNWDICIFCGQCQANCLTGKGIMLSREFDFATTGKREELKQVIEKEMVACDCCGELVAPFDQLTWVADKLGVLCFSNASLMLIYLRLLDLAMKELPHSQHSPLSNRADRIKILCPRCRRQAAIIS